MALKLFYITNRTDVALIAEAAGVDRVFVDMEYIGKAARQGGLDTVQSHHTVADVQALRGVLTRAELLVRVNPIHDATAEYGSTEEEVDAVVAAGADIIMLPFFKSAAEVARFLQAVGGRCRTMLLLETPEAVEELDAILALKGIDEIHIGLNDLSLGYGRTFLFELLSDGTVEALCKRLQAAGMTYGFGGVAGIGTGMLPAEAILLEHYRLGSSMVILSRSFCDCAKISDLAVIRETFMTGVKAMREFERETASHADSAAFAANQALVAERVAMIAAKIAAKNAARK